MKKIVVLICSVAVLTMLSFALSDLINISLYENQLLNFITMLIVALTSVKVSELAE